MNLIFIGFCLVKDKPPKENMIHLFPGNVTILGEFVVS